jgi:hypothetical protein
VQSTFERRTTAVRSATAFGPHHRRSCQPL